MADTLYHVGVYVICHIIERDGGDSLLINRLGTADASEIIVLSSTVHHVLAVSTF
jgi:hypothetical protein